MTTLTPDKLQKILADHKLWLSDENAGARANLSFANLRSADLSFANLSFANLRSADLSYANLRSANLSFADLRSADLSFANLRSANLRYANLSLANLSYQICPEIGSFTAFKKAKLKNGEYKSEVILTIQIPEGTKRVSCLSSRKCRAEKVKVLSAEDLNGTPISGNAIFSSSYNSLFIYKVGEEALADKFDDDPRRECSNGISFFITKEEAKDYEL